MGKKLSKADLGWMAAVIDLKGHIVQKKNRSRATPQTVLVVDCKDPKIIRKLSVLTGTKPEPRDARGLADFMRHPCREHCPEAHQHVSEHPWSPPGSITRWTITGVSAGIVLRNLLPYMAADDDYSELIDEVFEAATWTGQGAGMVRKSVMRLMNLGWAVPNKVIGKLFPEEDVA